MRQLAVLFTIFAATTFVAGAATAEDHKGKKGKKWKKEWHKELGKNVQLEITVEGDGDDISTTLVTALKKYTSGVSEGGRHLNTYGFVKVKGDRFLVRCKVAYVGTRSKSSAGTSFEFDASMLLKEGEEAVFGKSGGVLVKVKVKELK